MIAVVLLGATLALGCVTVTVPTATPLDCPSEEAIVALHGTRIPERYALEFVDARSDCLAHNRRVLGR